MQLYDPNRPKIFHRPAFLPGRYPIPRLQLWPLENGLIEIAMLLPLQDERFAGKYFSRTVHLHELPDIISLFWHDPELFLKKHFSNDPNGFRPDIGQEIKPKRDGNDSGLSISDLLEGL